MKIQIRLDDDLIKNDPFAIYALTNKVFATNYFCEGEPYDNALDYSLRIINNGFKRLVRYDRENNILENGDLYIINDYGRKLICYSSSFRSLLHIPSKFYPEKVFKKYLDILKKYPYLKIYNYWDNLLYELQIGPEGIDFNISIEGQADIKTNPFYRYTGLPTSFTDSTFTFLCRSYEEIVRKNAILDTIGSVINERLDCNIPEGEYPINNYNELRSATNAIDFTGILNNIAIEDSNYKYLGVIRLRGDVNDRIRLLMDAELSEDEDIDFLINYLIKYKNFFKKLSIAKIVIRGEEENNNEDSVYL